MSNDGGLDYLHANESLSLAATGSCPPDFQPQLQFEWLPQTKSIRLEWPVRAFAFDLVAKDDRLLVPDEWRKVGVVPEMFGRSFRSELSATGTAAYFMLRRTEGQQTTSSSRK